MSTSSLAIATESVSRLHPGRDAWVCPPRRLNTDPRVRKVEALMRRNLHLKLCLRELAGSTSISASRLSHLFKTETGVSPAQHLKSIRLQRAKELLEGSNLSIKEIAAHVGLDPSRLSKAFREAYGVTPWRYRFGHFPSDLRASENTPEVVRE